MSGQHRAHDRVGQLRHRLPVRAVAVGPGDDRAERTARVRGRRRVTEPARPRDRPPLSRTPPAFPLHCRGRGGVGKVRVGQAYRHRLADDGAPGPCHGPARLVAVPHPHGDGNRIAVGAAQCYRVAVVAVCILRLLEIRRGGEAERPRLDPEPGRIRSRQMPVVRRRARMRIGRQAQDAGDGAFGVGDLPAGLMAIGGQGRGAGQRQQNGCDRTSSAGEECAGGGRWPASVSPAGGGGGVRPG